MHGPDIASSYAKAAQDRHSRARYPHAAVPPRAHRDWRWTLSLRCSRLLAAARLLDASAWHIGAVLRIRGRQALSPQVRGVVGAPAAAKGGRNGRERLSPETDRADDRGTGAASLPARSGRAHGPTERQTPAMAGFWWAMRDSNSRHLRGKRMHRRATCCFCFIFSYVDPR